MSPSERKDENELNFTESAETPSQRLPLEQPEDSLEIGEADIDSDHIEDDDIPVYDDLEHEEEFGEDADFFEEMIEGKFDEESDFDEFEDEPEAIDLDLEDEAVEEVFEELVTEEDTENSDFEDENESIEDYFPETEQELLEELIEEPVEEDDFLTDQIKDDSTIERIIVPPPETKKDESEKIIISLPQMPGGSGLRAGLELNRGFVLERKLGTGTLGDAWKARDQIDERDVVVKLVPQKLQENEGLFSQFREAYRKAEMLVHPAICPMHRLTEDRDHGFFTIANYNLTLDLEAYYEQYLTQLGEFPLSQAVRVFWPIAQALDYAHSQYIYHEDIKPGNILIGMNSGVLASDFQYVSTARRLFAELEGIPVSERSADPAKDDQAELARVIQRLFYGEDAFETEPFPDAVSDEAGSNSGISDSEDVAEEERNASITVQSHAKYVKIALKRALSENPDDRFVSCKDFIRAMVNIPLEDEIVPPSILATAQFLAPLVDQELFAPATANSGPDLDLWPFGEPTAPEPEVSAFSLDVSPKISTASDVAPGTPKIKAGPVRIKKPSSPFRTMIVAALGAVAAAIIVGIIFGMMKLVSYIFRGGSDKGGNQQLVDNTPVPKPSQPNVVEPTPIDDPEKPAPIIEEGTYLIPGVTDEPLVQDIPEIPEIPSEEDDIFLPIDPIPPLPGLEHSFDPLESLDPGISLDTLDPVEPIEPITDPAFEPAPIVDEPLEPEVPEISKTLEQLAEEGDAEAQRMLGEHLLSGTGGYEANPKEAILWLQAASDQGDVNAMYVLGKCYESGTGLKEKDPAKAFALYKAAAEEGDLRSELRTGWCYGNGFGTEKDPVQAANWYMVAAEKGNAQAQARVAACYETGIGLEKNLDEAVKWYRRSAEQNNANAKAALERLDIE